MATSVLVVEDERFVADLLKERLDDEGYQVKVAYNGIDALQQLVSRSPDVITLDLYLPDVHGLSILRDLKTNPKTYRIPVVVISSSDEEQNARNLGADEFMKKPIDFPRLCRVLKSLKDKIKNGIQGGK